MGDQYASRWVAPTIVVLTAAAAAYLLRESTARKRTDGKRSKKAFILVITHEYKTVEDRDLYIKLFQPFAKYVIEHEPETLQFDLCISDKNPLKLIVFERYTSEAALTDVHMQSAAFKQFRKALEDVGMDWAAKTKDTYIESGIGWM